MNNKGEFKRDRKERRNKKEKGNSSREDGK